MPLALSAPITLPTSSASSRRHAGRNQRILFTTAMDMLNHLLASQVDHSLVRKLKTYTEPTALVVDELGYLEVIQGSVFETHTPVDSYSMLYLNVPYDHEIGEGKNQRLERIFLEHTFRGLKPGGVLVMVVPFDRVNDCKGVTPHFRDKAIYRLTEPEAEAYKQGVVFGVRRLRQERDKLTNFPVQQANYKLYELTRRYAEIPGLPDLPGRRFTVPVSAPAKLDYRGLPLDLMEDLLASSPAWVQARRVTHAPRALR
jgi:hypothetical protein